MNLRLSAAGEQQSILLFGLSAAEGKVEEFDAATAGRMRESRAARVGGVREALAGKLAALEQRAAGTTFMTGERLRGLLPDAKGKWDEAKREREKRVEELKREIERAFDVGAGRT